MSHQGLLPSCWGPPLWHSLHSIAMAYEPTEKTKIDFYGFFAILGNVLPCESCKSHYAQNFQQLQDSLKYALMQPSLAPDGLFRWVYDLHNLVNKQTKVPENKWPSYEEVVKKYEGFKAECGSTPGVCGAVSGTSTKRIRIIEEFGMLGDLSGEAIGLIVVSIALALSLGYIMYYCRNKRSKFSVF